ncbi:YgfZ/GcvT domain-containing protein [Hydrogenophaga pseudoflava]|jgi:folate-binding protein YgfZ|uniref:tRNA-modifying protein YgfZ n=1 Tax=Hydrogenophaga pseudoflava TaxID=47421 RepID=A0A4P6X1E8_HYDPS|nr:folate-binding protein YgfZ [Hydrogenophaga pseudoflava]QBM28396.1 tRNA-modifying protein YgfZ [Hydrogenophaga pseudoflava]
MSQAPEFPPANALRGVALLPRLGVIRAQGEEAAKFLHGQLTNDFSLLGLSEARLAGFCTAKGRLLASFIGFKRTHDEILLVCHADLLPATLKRLSMFVLRAKVKLTDASAEFQLRGLVGDAVPAALPAAPWSKLDADGAQLVRLYPADSIARALWVAPAGVEPPAGPALDGAAWDWLDVVAGVPLLSQPVVEAFVPQMVNMESVGGVNFKKGCYPGQEVVARSQFRGTLKRRAYPVFGDAPMAAGQEVFHDGDPSQPCGTVVAAAASPAGGWSAMVSMQTSAAEGGALRLGAADGPLLTLQPLPYPLLADV